MNNFNVGNWFESRANLNIKTFTVEGVEFELMALTDDLIDDVKLCESYADMIDTSANLGLSYNRKRVYDDVELSKDIDMLWSMDEVNIADLSPTVREQVGAEVCEISGITGFVEDALEDERVRDERAEEAKKHLEAEGLANAMNGDSLGDTSITLGQLQNDADKYAAA